MSSNSWKFVLNLRVLASVLLILLVGCISSNNDLDDAADPAETAGLITTKPPTPTRTASPTQSPTATSAIPSATPEPKNTHTPVPAPKNVYFSQPGDTFEVIARRFGLFPLDFQCKSFSPDYCPASSEDLFFNPNILLPAGTEILFPPELVFRTPTEWLIPDSEMIFSSAATEFRIHEYVDSHENGYLATHTQYLMMNAWNTGADIVEMVSVENSINPRLLLALLEHQCQCVLGPSTKPEPFMQADFYIRDDLYGQLIWAIYELSNGYYGWRAGTLSEVTLTDGKIVRLNPELNAGTAALYNLFSKISSEQEFWEALDSEKGFLKTYRMMFGDPWERSLQIYPDLLTQPFLNLPFEKGSVWSYTGGPHPAFESNGPLAALDFAPASAAPGCQPTNAWVTAAAEGIVLRSEFGLVTQDLDGDGNEQTGWVIMYLHIGDKDRVAAGTELKTGDPVGRPSCEGGTANGTHLHIARKLNGEWISAGSGPLPFQLDNWVAKDGLIPYKGLLVNGDQVLEACTCSWRKGWLYND